MHNTRRYARVYPRVCGGTARGCEWRAKLHGSIPACAGEPATPLRTPVSSTVYPRVCGGTTSVSRAVASAWGLSPRVRGNPHRWSCSGGWTRSIPACAGEPGTPRTTSAPPEVYPRVCGGTRRRGLRTGQVTGLSPRVRGNRIDTGPRSGLVGSIPACAGEPRG